MHKQYLEFYKGYTAKEAALPINRASLQQFFRLMATLMRNGGNWFRRHPRVASGLSLLGTSGVAYGASRMFGGSDPINTDVRENAVVQSSPTPATAAPVQQDTLPQNTNKRPVHTSTQVPQDTRKAVPPVPNSTKGAVTPSVSTPVAPQASHAQQRAAYTAKQRQYPSPTRGTFSYDKNSPQIEYKQYAAGDPRLKYYKKRLKNMGFARFGENESWIATPHGTDIQRTIPKGLNRGRLKELLARGMVPRGVFEDTVLFDKEPHV